MTTFTRMSGPLLAAALLAGACANDATTSLKEPEELTTCEEVNDSYQAAIRERDAKGNGRFVDRTEDIMAFYDRGTELGCPDFPAP